MGTQNWWRAARGWIGDGPEVGKPRGIGLAFGGGFARGIAHVGVLRAFEKNKIPIGAVAGISSGAMMAAAIASGATSEDIERVALSMRFRDVARWTLNWTGLAGSDRMIPFLARLLKAQRFEDMQIPLAIVATDLVSGKPVTFRERGDVVLPIRASCAYPGLFKPIRHEGRLLVDGFVAMEVPALPLRELGAARVISVNIPNQDGTDYGNMFSVINRSFQLMSAHSEYNWRRYSNVVISPPVGSLSWDSFASAEKLIQLGEAAAEAAMPAIRRWLQPVPAGNEPKGSRSLQTQTVGDLSGTS